MSKLQYIIADVVGLAGMVLMSVGAGMIYRPAGFIVGGIQLVALALFGFTPQKRSGE